MARLRILLIAALVLSTSALCLGADAAVPADASVEMGRPDRLAIHETNVFGLDTQMVVRGWVLCVSQDVAEQLAREKDPASAQSLYAELVAKRSCGQFNKLVVVLKKRLFWTRDARVFAADVKFSEAWASAFVVYGEFGSQ